MRVKNKKTKVKNEENKIKYKIHDFITGVHLIIIFTLILPSPNLIKLSVFCK